MCVINASVLEDYMRCRKRISQNMFIELHTCTKSAAMANNHVLGDRHLLYVYNNYTCVCVTGSVYIQSMVRTYHSFRKNDYCHREYLHTNICETFTHIKSALVWEEDGTPLSTKDVQTTHRQTTERTT